MEKHVCFMAFGHFVTQSALLSLGTLRCNNAYRCEHVYISVYVYTCIWVWAYLYWCVGHRYCVYVCMYMDVCIVVWLNKLWFGLVGFTALNKLQWLSTTVGYLMPNKVYTYILDICGL